MINTDTATMYVGEAKVRILDAQTGYSVCEIGISHVHHGEQSWIRLSLDEARLLATVLGPLADAAVDEADRRHAEREQARKKKAEVIDGA